MLYTAGVDLSSGPNSQIPHHPWLQHNGPYIIKIPPLSSLGHNLGHNLINTFWNVALRCNTQSNEEDVVFGTIVQLSFEINEMGGTYLINCTVLLEY